MSGLMREEFELAVVKMHVSHGVPPEDAAAFLETGSNGYRSVSTKSAWWAWQASRECLVIELPELKINGTWHFFGFVRGFRAAKKMMRSLYEIELNKIGVKTK